MGSFKFHRIRKPRTPPPETPLDSSEDDVGAEGFVPGYDDEVRAPNRGPVNKVPDQDAAGNEDVWVDPHPFPDDVDADPPNNLTAGEEPPKRSAVTAPPPAPPPATAVNPPRSGDADERRQETPVVAVNDDNWEEDDTASGGANDPSTADEDEIDEELEAILDGVSVEEFRETKRLMGQEEHHYVDPSPDGGAVYPENDEQGDGEYDFETTTPRQRPAKLHEVKLNPLFPLVDVDRFAQFRLAGSRVRPDQVRDSRPSEGLPFRRWRFGTYSLGVSAVPDHTLYAPCADSKLKGLDKDLGSASDEQIRQKLDRRAALFRRGPLVERLLWAIYLRVVATERSRVRLPHKWCAQMLWGADRLRTSPD
jgi:hypothetical protein